MLIWHLGSILLLGFGAIVLALVVRSFGELIARHSRLRARWATLVVWALIVGGLVGIATLAGDEFMRQIGELRTRLPEAADQARNWIENLGVGGEKVVEAAEEATGDSVTAENAVKTAGVTLTVMSHFLAVVLIALYLSFNPRLYIRGVVALAPPARRAGIRRALAVSGKALRGWLLGQLVAMLAVGVLTGIGLWLVGVPLALVLGLLTGLLEFVPIAGPFLAAVPGLLLAFAAGPEVALAAALVYLGVQQVEGAVITPLAQRWSVHLPPALGLFAIVVFGLLFGVPGLLFATPLTVVIMVLLQNFYVQRGHNAE